VDRGDRKLAKGLSEYCDAFCNHKRGDAFRLVSFSSYQIHPDEGDLRHLEGIREQWISGTRQSHEKT